MDRKTDDSWFSGLLTLLALGWLFPGLLGVAFLLMMLIMPVVVVAAIVRYIDRLARPNAKPAPPATPETPWTPPPWFIPVNVLVIVPLMCGLLGMIEDIPFMIGCVGTFIIAALVFGPLYLANRFELVYRKMAVAARATGGRRTSPEATPAIRKAPRRRKARAAASRPIQI
jgi:hypothetical protein